MFNIQATGDKGDDNFDTPSKSVKAYSRIYYTTSTKNSLTHYAITKVTGGWTSYDPYVFFKNTNVTIAQQGKTFYTGCSKNLCGEQMTTKSVSGSTFSYTSPMNSWIPIAYHADLFNLFTKQTATLYDSSSSWNFTFENRLP